MNAVEVMSIPDRSDRVFDGTGRIAEFAFDERVTRVFDDMVSRSVPMYGEVQRMQTELIIELLPDNGVVCDLGCSTGTTIDLLASHPRCPEGARFVGLDNSAPMIAEAKAKLAGPIREGRVRLEERDLNGDLALPRCNCVLMNWTLQFVRPMLREGVLRAVSAALAPGGMLILSEKMLVEDSILNRTYIELYHRYKRQHGYSDVEIQRKREALENVLIPYRVDENIELLRRCGFRFIDLFFRWFNFGSLVAIKPGSPPAAADDRDARG